ncbi:exodeoxyribonuclease VII small subunit [Mycoplasmopsis adleri]|uniref:exodeoxyribonuclease VII small subunit n=1 Tax=Mycoplasmopsis adleri TaxID=51362 RepID=UPI00387332BB
MENKEKTFKQLIQEINNINEKFKNLDDIDLEQAVKDFKLGNELIKEANKRLNEVKKEIEIIDSTNNN